MKYRDYIVSVDDSRFRLRKTGLTLDLYESGVTIEDGTIIGTRAVDINANYAQGIELVTEVGSYKFEKIPWNKKYDIVISGPGVTTQIPEPFTNIEIGLPSNITGGDIPFKNNSNQSIQNAIESLDATSVLPTVLVLQNSVDNLEDSLSNFSLNRVIISGSTDGTLKVSNITVTELNYLDDSTANIQQQIDNLIIGAGKVYTPNRVTVTDSTGNISVSAITPTELNYLDDTTANLQAQINNIGDKLILTANKATVTDGTGKLVASTVVTKTQLEYLQDTTSNIGNEIRNIRTKSQSLSFTPNRVVYSDSTGLLEVSVITKAELEYLDDSTANIQSQLNVGFNLNTGKSAETIYKGGGKKAFLTIQEAITEAFSVGGNVIVHEKSSVYNEALTLQTGVNINVEAGAIIETNSDAPSMTANGVSCVISGDGQIKNIYNGATKREAIRIIGGSSVTIKNKYIYSRGSTNGLTGPAVFVSGSYCELFSDKVECLNAVPVRFTTGSSGIIKVKDKIVGTGAPGLYIDTVGNLDVINTIIQGVPNISIGPAVVYFNSGGGIKTFTDSRLEYPSNADTAYPLYLIANLGTLIFSGVELITNIDISDGCIKSAIADPDDAQNIIYIRKPCWSNINVVGWNEDPNSSAPEVKMKGQFNVGYGD